MNQEINKAIQKSLKILNKNPDSTIFASLSEIYRKQGDFEKALELCQAGLEKHPRFAKGWTVLGKICLNRDKKKEAVQAFEKALNLEPKNLFVLRQLGRLYLEEKNFKKTKQVYEMIYLHYPENETIATVLKTLQKVQLNDYDYFSEKPLPQAVQEISQAELKQKPLIRPHSCKQTVNPDKKETLQQMLKPFPNQWMKKPLPVKAQKKLKLQKLNQILKRIDAQETISDKTLDSRSL